MFVGILGRALDFVPSRRMAPSLQSAGAVASETPQQDLPLLDGDDPWGLGEDRKPAPRASRPAPAPAPRPAKTAPRRQPAATTAAATAVPASPAPVTVPASVPHAIPAALAAARPAPRISAILTALVLSGVLVWAGWMAGTSWAAGAQAAQTTAPADAGRLVVSSHPAGAVVTLDGRTLGTTPVAIDFRPGPVSIVVTSPDGQRAETIDATIAAGVTLARHLTWPARAE